MKTKYSRYIYLIALFLIVGASTTTAQQNNQAGASTQSQVSQIEADDLVYMREEEKLARDSYEVLGEEWGLAIFSNISQSEQRHMDALELLLDRFGIADPIIDESDVGNFADPTLQDLFNDLMTSGMKSEMDALKVGAAIEETDILDIQHAIERTENQDIIATYENLLCGSRNHLRAFVGQIEFYGDIYTPVLMSDDDFDAIVDFPMERRCGANNGGKGKGNRKGKGKGKGKGNCNGTGSFNDDGS